MGFAAAALAAGCGGERVAVPTSGALESAQICAIVTAGAADAPHIVATGVRGRDARLARSQAWLEANAQRAGVSVTESGLQYEVLHEGEADAPSPVLGDFVCVHYRGITVDGREFDSSCGGLPLAFPSDGLIAGWEEALPMMREGDIWELTTPPNLAYGERGSPPVVQPNEALIFRMALLRVLDGDFPSSQDCSVAPS